MSQSSEYKLQGYAAAALYLVLLLLLLLFLSLKAERMEPDQGSMEMALGFDQTGGGEEIPISNPPPSGGGDPSPQPALASEAESDVSAPTEQSNTAPSNQSGPNNPQNNANTEASNEWNDMWNNSSNTSSGPNTGPGKQGRPDGRPGGAEGGGGTGKGYPGTGTSLGNGDAYSLPKPQVRSNEDGKVVIQACVDAQGKVSRILDPNYKGSTAIDQTLRDAALQSAKKATFPSDPQAPDCRTAIITYTFRKGYGP